MVLTRMIFAIQMTDTKPTRLRVSGDIGTPALTSLRRGDKEPSSVGCVDGSWMMDLDAGDYIFEIQVDAKDWVAGRLDIVTELTPGQRPPAFVYYGPLPQSPELVGLAAWAATVLYIDPPESSAIGDSKDPWPPPPPPLSSVTLAPVSAEWFTAKLAAARTRIADQFTEAGGKCVPASALDTPVTEP